jgi:hypothetical protein
MAQPKYYYVGSSNAVVISDVPTHTHAKNITHTQHREVEEEEEEALEETEDQWYATNFNNQDTMQENFHFHLQHLCIVAHQIMTQKNFLHYWGRSRKREIRTISGFWRKQGMKEETST